MVAKRRITTKLDVTDQRIVALLCRDARLGAAAIGRAIGLSRQAVQGRIASLEARRVIRGYHAATGRDGELLDAVLFLTLAVRPCEPVLRWLAELEGVGAVHSLAGETDAIVYVSVPNVVALTRLNDRIAGAPAIASVRSQVVLRSLRGAPPIRPRARAVRAMRGI